MAHPHETLHARLAGLIDRIRRGVSDAEYGRKRMLELRSGHVFTEETRRRRELAEIRHLNNLFTDEPISCSTDGESDSLDAPDQDRRNDWPRLSGT
jgi:hypothetical protein